MTGSVAAALTVLPAFAGDGAFVLSSGQLDRVTAGGVSVISDGFSATAALGDQALSDSVTSASVDPESGSADAYGLGAGTDGSQAIADTSASGQNDTIVVTTSGTADGASYDITPTVVSSTSLLTLTANESEAASYADASAPETFTSASSGIYYVSGTTQVSSGADGAGVDLSGSGSSTQVGTFVQDSDSGIQITSGATADGSLFTVTESGTVTGGTTSGIGIDTQAYAETASAGTGTSDVTTVIISNGSDLIVRTSGLATQTGETLADPNTLTSITLNGVPTTATVTGTSRTTLRGDVSRSLSIQMLTR